MFNFGGFDFGGHGHGGMHDDGPQREVDNTKFYKLLGVEKTATPDEVRKAFRKLAISHHPDRGGDPEKFKELQKAYEVLSDKDKRETYDRFGEEAALQGGPSGPAGNDLFSHIFGGGGGRRETGPRKGEDTVFPLRVELEDLYNGVTKKLKLTKRVICTSCSGKGGKSVQTCTGCKGRGVKIMMRQIGPGMIQQMQTTCPECKGQGETMSEKDRCKECQGEKTVPREKILEVPVERGMKHGDKIKFRDEGDELPGVEPGDVICVLQQKEHATYRREGLHLFYKRHISLLEALTGFQFPVKHLDGRVLLVKSDPGVIYRPGDVKGIEGEGMPKPRHPHERGFLFVELVIDFPANGSIGAVQHQLLAQALPAPAPADADVDMSDVHETNLVDVDIKAEMAKRENGGSEAYNEDGDDDDGRPHGPQCRTQ